LVAACAWIVVGVVVMAWAGRSPDFLGPVVAVMLVVSGGAAVVRLFADRSADRWLGALFGLSEIAFGLVGLLWPDATLIVIAILFGGRTAIFGLSLVWRGVFSRRVTAGGTRTSSSLPRGRTSWSTGLRWVAGTLVLLIASAAFLVSHTFREGIPVADAFYDAPQDVPDTPGRLLRWAPYDGDLPAGMEGFRLLYVTTNAADQPVLASAALALPKNATAAVPLIAWAHGTVGVARGCAPTIGRDAITEDGMPAMDSLARNHWAMVATDYPGMGTEGNFPYLVGQGEGRAVLDAARAAHQVPAARLADKTVIWGHSQGGHAALWAGELAATYAPELNVVGTAALSPASNPEAIAQAVLSHPEMVGASLGVSFVVDAYTRYYDNLDLNQIVAPPAIAIVREAAARCTSEDGTLITALTGLAIANDQPILRPGSLEGPFGDRLRQNTPTGPWSAPLFIAQGEADEVIPFTINKDYVAGLCRGGFNVQFQGYPGGTHMSILETGSPLSLRLEQWTRARLAGEPSKADCS
jgi:pimeloyl-ACP methyl ester carboxylesterase